MMVKKIRNYRGASAVEFALVILIFSIFVFGIIDFGWYFFCQHSIELATREGSRVGVVRGDDDSIKQEIRDRASIAVDLNDSNISFYTDSATNATTVTTQYTHHFFSPLIGAFFSGGSTVIEAEATYRIEPEPYVPPS
jgi:Flp pilus assembly protein TadG